MPNAFAHFALLVWPVVTLVLFRRLPADRALIWSLLGGYLLLPPLPAAFDFPMLPPLSKDTIPSLAAFVAVLALHRADAPLFPRSPVGRVLIAIFVLSPIVTVLANPEPVVFGRHAITGLGPKDAAALSLLQFLTILPFLLARQLLASEESLHALLRAFALAGLAYSLPMLAEVRLSPQLNTWVYGYFQHLFEQMVRGEGYRPIVFLYHGLSVAFFAMTAVVAALALWRFSPSRHGAWWLFAALYLAIVLVLCKSLGSFLYMLLLAPLVLLLGVRTQIRVAAVIALMATAYPVLKGAHLVPTDWILSQAERISPERANSLRFRLDNEEALQARAEEKPLFGWGSWGRNHVYAGDGRPLTVADGRWIITMGVYGWVGFLVEFLLLSMPIYLLWYRFGAGEDPPGPWVGPLALLLAINLVELLPNATLTPLTWIVCGALWGLAETTARAGAREKSAEARPEPVWRPVM